MITDRWRDRANFPAADDVDRLRQVMDPSDRGGVKNVYLDRYLKHHLVRHLRPRPDDVLLEIGCGTGRLVEHLAPAVRRVYGTDLIDEFVLGCRRSETKAKNAEYVLQRELDVLMNAKIGKLYVVWVLMYVREDDALVELLGRYRRLLPALRSAVLIEQVKRERSDEFVHSAFYARYRTIEGLSRLFERAGFRVDSATVMPERRVGPLYNALRVGYRALPRRAAPLGEAFFLADLRLSRTLTPMVSPSSRTPTDVAFELSVP